MKYRIVTDIHADSSESVWVERFVPGFFRRYWERVLDAPPGPIELVMQGERTPRGFFDHESARMHIDNKLKEHEALKKQIRDKRIIRTTNRGYP